jgi:hypothetical protein
MNALSKVYQLDRYLIEKEVHERTIVARFAIYYQEELNLSGYSGYNMDVEYNRNYFDSKRTSNFQNGTYPDVIVHKRGNNEQNLCIIEFKTVWGKGIDRDLLKLKDFSTENDIYQYGIGYSITFTHDFPVIQHVVKGQLKGNPLRREVLE